VTLERTFAVPTPKGSLEFDFTTPPSERPPRPNDRTTEAPRALRVAELDRLIKRSLDRAFTQPVWVEGEVTGARAAPSGHLYFALRDEEEEAAIDCAIYKTNITPRARSLLKDGARVRLRGQPDFWAPRGRLQLICDRVAPAGRGALLEALEKLKEKLAAEGLFADERKRKLPREPRIIGVVTSSGGAAIHDVCKVAFRRGPAHILLAPALVQGANAGDSIRRALFALQRVPGVDVIIVGRGGGSSEDLAAFNEEGVVRAVAACNVPVVSAVGHEVDVTLTDFAADARAATPSQAAEMLVPDVRERAHLLAQANKHLARVMRARLAEHRAHVAGVLRALSDPRLAIASFQQSLDDRTTRLATCGEAIVARRRAAIEKLQHRLAFQHPRVVIDRERTAILRADERMVATMRALVMRRASDIASSSGRLDALSPLKVLARGYAIATTEDGRALRDASDAREGDKVIVRVHAARIDAKITRIEKLK
jgi:exodeoxyribonuclease VII large subunit